MFTIKFENITVKYKCGNIGLSSINLTINPGEFVFLTGASGSGKSTFLKILTKEINPTIGRLYFGLEDVTLVKANRLPYIRRSLGIIKDKSFLLEDRNVYKNIELAILAGGKRNDNTENAIFKALGIVGMKNKVYDMPISLSVGEKARIDLARAIVNMPAVLIIDELTSSLDPQTAWDIVGILDEINRMGITIIMSTHDKGTVDIMRKRVLTLNEGRLIGDAKKGKYGYLI